MLQTEGGNGPANMTAMAAVRREERRDEREREMEGGVKDERQVLKICKHPSLPHFHQVYTDMADTLSQAAAARASLDYLGREHALGCFYRVAIFGPGLGQGHCVKVPLSSSTA